MISIIISTKNRPESVHTCLKSILLNTYHRFEILLFDQSDDDKTQKIVYAFRSKKIKYVKLNSSGKSKALNIAIRKTKNEILAFTDDDCIVSKFWLKEIINHFKCYPQTAGIFGNTYPYESEKHPQQICPATFIAKKAQTFNDPDMFLYRSLGQGNNMCLRKSVLEKVGFFKHWLGVGSISLAGEESEVIFRILLSKRILMTNPKMIVYHNRWLTGKQENFQQSRYTCGFMSFFSYYLMSKNSKYALKFIKIRLSERLLPKYQNILHLLRELAKEALFFTLEVLDIFRGICIGLCMALRKNI